LAAQQKVTIFVNFSSGVGTMLPLLGERVGVRGKGASNNIVATTGYGLLTTN